MDAPAVFELLQTAFPGVAIELVAGVDPQTTVYVPREALGEDRLEAAGPDIELAAAPPNTSPCPLPVPAMPVAVTPMFPAPDEAIVPPISTKTP